MPVAAGTSLGPHEILAQLSAGGMGEVYRARDTGLRREVAIKVASEGFSGRFQREADAISSLNHPNICTLYDVGPQRHDHRQRNQSLGFWPGQDGAGPDGQMRAANY